MKKLMETLFPTLGRKIALAVTLVLASGGGLFVFYAHRTGVEMLLRQGRGKAHGIMESSRSILEHTLIEGNHANLKGALRSAISARQAKELYILRNDGTVALSVRDSSTIRQRFALEQFVEQPEFPTDRFLSVRDGGSASELVISPIAKTKECSRCHSNDGDTMGYFAAEISIDNLRAAAMQHRTTNIVFSFLTFLGVGVVIYVALLRLVIRPVKRLQHQILQIQDTIDRSGREEYVRLEGLSVPQRRDEIAGLISSFNRLVERLNEAHARLTALHQEQLEQADKLAKVGEMAASIAHEIKNPLCGVSGALQVFDQETAAGDPRKEILQEMLRQLDRMNRAVNDLLTYARPTPPVMERVNPNSILERTLSLLTLHFNGNAISLKVNLQHEMALLTADPKLLQQLFWNILLNAVQAIDPPGTLEVSSAEQNGMVVIQIADSGKGIPPEHREDIYKAFYSTKRNGTGLGLTISKKIVEQHRGRLSLGARPGGGTVASIALPIRQGGD